MGDQNQINALKQQINDLEKQIKEAGYQCKLPFCDEAVLAENHGWHLATQGDFSNPGTVYKLTLPGTLKTLYQFVHGEQPKDPLVQATDGNFYGTTELGGASAEGSVFKITPSGTRVAHPSFFEGWDSAASPF